MDRNLTRMSVEKQYEITKITIDYDKSSFSVQLQGHYPIDTNFIEIESFIDEFDPKLHEYLKCKATLNEKIYEAVSIGYDFTPMITELMKSFIEFGIVTPKKM